MVFTGQEGYWARESVEGIHCKELMRGWRSLLRRAATFLWFPVVLCVSVDVEQSSRDWEWAADFCRCVRERKQGWNQEQTKKQGQSQTKSQEETRTLRYYGLNKVALTLGATARRLRRVIEEVLIVKMRCSWWILTVSSTPADNHPCLCYVEFLSSAILW